MHRAHQSQTTTAEVVADFIAAMADVGIRPLEPIEHKLGQGELVRFRAEGDKRGRQNGWAILHLDGHPAGAFGHYRLGLGKQTWRADRGKLTPPERLALAQQLRTARAASEARRRSRERERREFALKIWRDSFDPFGTLAELYLRRRGLKLTQALTSALQFHPSCPFGRDDDDRPVRYPCLVALVRDVRTNEPVGIHRTALTDKGERIDRKLLGTRFDGTTAIKLTPDAEIASSLAVAEGIETALSVLEDAPWPIWAMGSEGGLRALPVLGGVDTLTIFADNDESGVGQQAARDVGMRWVDAGREVFVHTPPKVGHDFNDLVGARHGR